MRTQSNPVVSEPAAPPSLFSRVARWVGPWQPFTGPGVASFATASPGRVLAFQLVGAGAVAAIVGLSLQLAWMPAVEASFPKLPATGAACRQGRLVWPDTNSVLLGERPQLALGVTPVGGLPLGQNSDVQLEFHPTSLRLRGLFGFTAVTYPPNLALPLTQTGAQAAWEAWRTLLLAVFLTATALLQLLLWWSYGLLCVLPMWALAALLRCSPGIGGVFRVCLVGLLTPSLVGTTGVFLYATRAISLTELGVTWSCALVAGAGWIGWGILSLPKTVGDNRRQPNPFTSDKAPKPNTTPSKAPNPSLGRAGE